jgi:hypothetical protein
MKLGKGGYARKVKGIGLQRAARLDIQKWSRKENIEHYLSQYKQKKNLIATSTQI